MQHHERLRLAGAALLKCVLEGYAIGPELARFTFDHLVEDERPFHIADSSDANGAFSSAREAYRALCDFAPNFASLWSLRKHLGTEVDLEMYVTPMGPHPRLMGPHPRLMGPHPLTRAL